MVLSGGARAGTLPALDIPARRFATADSEIAPEQIRQDVLINDLAAVDARRAELTAASQARRSALEAAEQPEGGAITPQYLTAAAP